MRPSRDRVVADIGKWIPAQNNYVSCDHGPFYLPALSTADSAPAPHVRCSVCMADCSSLVAVTKQSGMIEIENLMERSVVFYAFYGRDVCIPPGGHAIYSHGRFFTDRTAAELSLARLGRSRNPSQGEDNGNGQPR